MWIALIKGEVVDGIDRCRAPRMILEDAKDGKVTIFVSRLTVVEVHKKRHYAGLTRDEDDELHAEFFKHEYIRKVDVDNWVSERARELAWEFGIGANDAIHVASAIRVKAEVLHHWDGDFGKVPADVMASEEPVHWDKQMSFIS